MNDRITIVRMTKIDRLDKRTGETQLVYNELRKNTPNFIQNVLGKEELEKMGPGYFETKEAEYFASHYETQLIIN